MARRRKSRGDYGRTGSGTSQSYRPPKKQDSTKARMDAVKTGYSPAGHGRTSGVGTRPGSPGYPTVSTSSSSSSSSSSGRSRSVSSSVAAPIQAALSAIDSRRALSLPGEGLARVVDGVESAVEYAKTDSPVKKLDRIETGKGVRSKLGLEDVVVSAVRDLAGRDNVRRSSRGPVVTSVRQRSDQAKRVARDPRTVSRTEAMGRSLKGRRAAGESRPSRKTGTFGAPTVRQFVDAAERGQLRRTKDGRIITVPQRRARRDLGRSRQEFRRVRRRAGQQHYRSLRQAGLDDEQARVLSAVLKRGRKAGASPKEMLAAVETALVETGIRNPSEMTDHDSQGWRQERRMYYPNPTNVRASADRFFQETAEAGRGAGMTAGQLAQAVQRSAFPEKYDQRQEEAVPLLRAFNRAPSRGIPRRVRTNLRASQARAVELGVPGVRGTRERLEAAKGRNEAVRALVDHSWPLGVRGKIIATASDHGNRAFGNWMSDNAVDIEVPVGTPVKAIRDSVVTKVSGSAPNHAANPAGWTVYLRDKEGQEYSYMHLENYNVKVGDRLKAGQTFGQSGAANGVPHLHLAVLKGAPGKALRGGRVSGPKKVKGPFAGSRRIVAKILGAPVHGDHGQPESSATGYHNSPNAYAQDIPLSGPDKGENEPEYNQRLLDQVTRRIRSMGGQVPDLKMGMGRVTGYLRGYELEIIPDSASNAHGTGPHLHIGARWTGAEPPPGTVFGTGSGSGSGGALDGGPSTGGGSGSGGGQRQEELPGGAGAYDGSIAMGGLTDFYSLIMNAGSVGPGDTGLLDEFIGDRARPRRRR